MIITVCRKPFSGSATDNVSSVGCGAINIDSCRITFETDGKRKETKRTPREDRGVWTDKNSGMKKENSVYADADPKGRFPANVVLDLWAVKPLDKQSGVSVSSGGRIGNAEGAYAKLGASGYGTGHIKGDGGFGDVGGASRYFKVIKWS